MLEKPTTEYTYQVYLLFFLHQIITFLLQHILMVFDKFIGQIKLMLGKVMAKLFYNGFRFRFLLIKVDKKKNGFSMITKLKLANSIDFMLKLQRKHTHTQIKSQK